MRRLMVGVVMAVAAVGLMSAAPVARAADPVVEQFHGLTPARLLDTRAGGMTIDGLDRATGALAGGATRELRVTARGGVPAAGVGSVALNVTVDGASATGYLTLWPTGVARPGASNLNFVAGQTVANMVIVPLGTDGRVSIYNGGTGGAEVLVDVLGWFPTGDAFHGLTPARVLDTRAGAPTVDAAYAGIGSVAGESTLDVAIGGRGGVPASGVGAVALNVTVTGPQRSGYLTVFPAGDARPNASNVNFAAERSVPNLVIVPLGADGKVSLFNGSTGRTELLVDVLGWFPTGSSFTGLNPTRLLDTRAGAPTIDGRFSGPVLLEPGTDNLVVGGRGGVPSSGVGAVVLNVTVVDPTDGGYLSVYPLGAERPNASNLNFVAGETVANAVVVPLGLDGQIKLFLGGMPNANELGRLVGAQVLVDVLGWFAGPPAVVDPEAPTFRADGFGSTMFGTPHATAMAQLGARVGSLTYDQTYFLTASPSGGYVDPANNVAFDHPVARLACGVDTCLLFGGATAETTTFLGWSSSDDRYLDVNGLGVDARISAFRSALTGNPEVICGNAVAYDTTSGLEVAADYDFFVAPFTGDQGLRVYGLSAGKALRAIEPGC